MEIQLCLLNCRFLKKAKNNFKNAPTPPGQKGDRLGSLGDGVKRGTKSAPGQERAIIAGGAYGGGGGLGRGKLSNVESVWNKGTIF